LLIQEEFGTNCAVDKHIGKNIDESVYRPIFKRSNIGQ